MPKGEKIKGQRDKWISYHLRDFKTLLLSLLSKVGFLWGEMLIMGKRGVFEILNQFLLE
jgi:hypothetical protein